MNETGLGIGSRVVLDASRFNSVVDVLLGLNYRVVGPVVKGSAIIYDELTSAEDLPRGFADKQAGGSYRLFSSDTRAFFHYNLGPVSWKKFLYPPVKRLWQAERKKGGFKPIPEKDSTKKTAFFGVRPCELNAISIHDKILCEGEHIDASYLHMRENILIIAVNCSVAGGTCFCESMDTGPKADSGFDIALTEVLKEESHFFSIEIGTKKGVDIVKHLDFRESDRAETEAADGVVSDTATNMGRMVDTSEIKEMLYRNYESSRWDEVGRRCLACGNCTMVCPTCFCINVEDTTSLTGDIAERWRRWDSCFTMEFSYIHGGNIRTSHKARYRQWLMHKLAAWIDQFGSSGCVGCGRCITWCPVGIDITEEVRAIRDNELEKEG